MKHFYTAIFVALFAFNTTAQETEFPISYDYQYLLEEPVLVELPSLDLERVAEEDLAAEMESGKTYCGRVVPVELDFFNEAVWTTLPDGSRVGRVALSSAGALSQTVYFSEFRLPEGTSLFAYGPDYELPVGPIDHTENNDHLQFLTGEVFGDVVILEYFEPLGITEEPLLKIRGIGNHYRYVYQPEVDLRGGSDFCEVNVACPEGEEWMDEANAVTRLEITDGQFIGLCTGALMNNTSWDYRQILLTALHCTEGVSDEDLQVLQVKFNFQRPNCETGSYPQNRNRVGVVKLGDSNCGGGFNGSDFGLYEIEDYISDNWMPYFAGWRATSTGSGSGVTIHHPSGDIKKISTYTTSLLNGTWQTAGGAHWRVRWAETETNHGVTEGGSSGSPLFDADHYVIGTLTGGGSFCNNPTAYDYYGKMSYHFYNNPNSIDERLAALLDPTGTGEQTLPGTYREGVVNVEETTKEELSVYPNPTQGVVTIRTIKDNNFNTYRVFDNVGKLLIDQNLNQDQFQIDLSALPSGIYLIQLSDANGNVLTRKVTRY